MKHITFILLAAFTVGFLITKAGVILGSFLLLFVLPMLAGLLLNSAKSNKTHEHNRTRN